MSYFDHPLFDVLSSTLPQPFSSHLADLMSNDDLLGLVSLDVDRSREVTFAEVFYKELFRKVEDAPLGIDTKQVAIDSFLEVERENVLTNEKIKELDKFCTDAPFSPIAIFFRRVRKQIEIILETVSFKEIEPRITFGATMNLSRGNTVFGRFNNPTVTAPCLEYLRTNGYVRRDYSMMNFPLEENAPSPFGAEHDDFKIVAGSVADTVPKTAKTDRFITKGEVVNLAYQSGVSDRIVQALRNFGLDKRVSESIHKVLVEQASIDGLLATRDLSAASDRIVSELGNFLLPPELCEVLFAFRSEYIQINDKQHKLQMLSPAGNGFTFDVETLIFYAIALVASTDNSIDVYSSAPPFVSVYGDDIILPSIYAERLDKIFSIVGFKVNLRKSFSTGKFRESCGGDFYNGNDVRGYNVKSLPRTPDAWIGICNAIRRVCYYNNSNHWRFQWCEDLWSRLVKHVPEPQRLYGPKHYGDSCINTEDESLYTLKLREWKGEYIKIRATSGEEYTSVGNEIHGNRTRANTALRLVTHASLRTHGLRETKDGFKYPYSLLKDSKTAHYVNKWIPYTLYGQASDDVAEIFDTLVSVNAYHLMNSRSVIARNVIKQREQYQQLSDTRSLLLDALTILVNTKSERARKVQLDFLNFAL